eukprot:tig00020515_g9777.t1
MASIEAWMFMADVCADQGVMDAARDSGLLLASAHIPEAALHDSLPHTFDLNNFQEQDEQACAAFSTTTATASGLLAVGGIMDSGACLSYAPDAKTRQLQELRVRTTFAENAPVVQNHIQKFAVTVKRGSSTVGLGCALPGWGQPGAYALNLIPEMCICKNVFIPVPGAEYLGEKFRPELISPSLETGSISYDEHGAMIIESRLWLKAKDLAAYKLHEEQLRCRVVITRCATPEAPEAVVAEGTTPAYRCYCKAETADKNAGGHGSTKRKEAPVPSMDRPKRQRGVQ